MSRVSDLKVQKDYNVGSLDLFSEVTQAIASELDPQKTIFAILDKVFDFFNPRGVSIMVREGDTVHLVARRTQLQRVDKASSRKAVDQPAFKVGEGVVGKAVLTGKPTWVNDTKTDPTFISPPGKSSSIRSIISVPMKVRGRVTGAINVSFATPHTFTEDEITILKVIATPAAYAIQNAYLFEKITEERSKLELIQTSMRDGITVARLDGTITFLNSAAKEMLGVSDKIIGRNAIEVAKNLKDYARYGIDYDISIVDMVKSITKGKALKSHLTVKSDPPRFIEASYFPLRNVTNRVIGIVGSYRDISESIKQAQKIERQLKETDLERKRWRALFENVEELILLVGPDGRIKQANSAAEILTGLDEKDLIDHEFEKIFPLVNEKGVKLVGELSPVKTALTTHEQIDYIEAKTINSEGRETWLGISVTPTKTDLEDEQTEQVVLVMRDVSRLKEIDRAKSDFVSMASHELRTPLTIINGYIDLFMSGDLGDISKPELAHYHQVFMQIQRSTARLNNLVEDLLNVSRIEQGRLNLNLEKMNLSLLIQDVVEEMTNHAKASGHELKFIPPVTTFLDMPMIIKADHEKIKEVLINLIDNAIKYTKGKGLIEVGVKRGRKEYIVSVKDNGPGIPKQLIPRIFEKFQRLEGTYVKDSVGTGLGLYIVREILRAHGGRIWVESQVGKGSTFYFSLPHYGD